MDPLTRKIHSTLAHSYFNWFTFLLAGVHSQPLIAIEQAGLMELIGEDNVFGDIDEALNRARQILGLPPSTCTVRKPVQH